jgi:alpha-galactosidase
MTHIRKPPLVLAAITVLLGAAALAGGGGAKDVGRSLAPTPPLGWNSFDAFCGDVNEQEVKANAAYMAKRLAKYGWDYVVVDYYWYFPHPATEDAQRQEQLEVAMDEYGRLLPAENRFPSAAGGKGFKPLADYVHNLGLKFGIHIMRGIPRAAVKRNLPILGAKAHAQDIANLQNICLWSTAMYGVDAGKPAGQAYYDSIAKLYAEWGVDFIKADDMSWADPPAAENYHAAEIAALHRAIVKSGRPMVLSLSPGPSPVAQAAHLRKYAELWRISDDFWDSWELVKKQFGLCRAWVPYIGPDRWPDADMLPLGRIRIRGFNDGERHSRLTPDEVRTLLSLWIIFRSPLMIGGDLPTMDASTLAYFTNPEAIAVNQHSRNNRELFAHGNQIAWAADAPDGKARYLAVFNAGDTGPTEVAVPWSALGLSGKCAVRDIWGRKDLGAFEKRFAPKLPSHGAGLYRVSVAD